MYRDRRSDARGFVSDGAKLADPAGDHGRAVRCRQRFRYGRAILAARLSEVLGQQVLVENVGGAGGMTGTARVANAPPDGYQFVLGSVDTFAMNQSLYKKLPYQAATDFVPVGLAIEQPILLIARNDLPANTVPQFIAYGKANPGKMQYGSAGVGSGSHLTCARMNAAMGIEATHIPYRGSAQAMQDLLAGRIDYFCALGAAAMAPLEGNTAKPSRSCRASVRRCFRTLRAPTSRA